ncbi:MAG: class I SAM-dependent methyltransferase [Nitrospinota bacterium]
MTDPKALRSYYREQLEDAERMYGDRRRAFHQWRRLRVARRILKERLPPLSRVLEVGCGDGYAMAQLLEGLPVGQYVGLDLSSHKLQAAKKRRPSGLFLVADSLGCPVADNSCDAVLLFEVLEHLPDPVAALREVHRMLREGGVFFSSVPVDAPWAEALVRLGRSLRRRRGGRGRRGRKRSFNEHLHFITRAGLRRWLEEANLDLMEAEPCVFHYPLLEPLSAWVPFGVLEAVDRALVRVRLDAFGPGGALGLSLGSEYLVLCARKAGG